MADRDPIHLAICIPGGSMPMESVRCLGAMLMDLMARPLPGLVRVSQHYFESSMLPWVRTKVVNYAIKAGATHLLLVDSDMTYPADGARRLLAHGRPFVAANATTRRPPIRWVAKAKDGAAIPSHEIREGLTPASSCGVAFALVERRVFEACERPLFDFELSDSGWVGEDVHFCRRAVDAGFRPMIDNSLSMEIGHVGSYVYAAADVEAKA